MSTQKRRTNKKKKKDVSVVGDLFRILFALSMLIVAILVAFFVFQSVSDFRLPDLKKTTAAESSQPITIQSETTEKQTTEAETETTLPETSETETESETESEEELYADAESLMESVEAEESRRAEEESEAASRAESKAEDKPVVHPDNSTQAAGDKPVLPQRPSETVGENQLGPGVTMPAETLPPETVEGGFRGPV